MEGDTKESRSDTAEVDKGDAGSMVVDEDIQEPDTDEEVYEVNATIGSCEENEHSSVTGE